MTVLSGCANLAPEYNRPVAPVPVQWQSASSMALAPSSAIEPVLSAGIGWREFLLDARLRATVEAALANNRDLRIAALNIERARAQYGVVRSTAFPLVEAGASVNRGRSSGNQATGAAARTSSQYSVDLGVTSFELDLFGRIRNLSESALQNFFEVEETRRATQISLIAEVAGTWLQLAADQQQLALARDTLASQRRSFELVERMHALGAQSGLALAQARSTVDAARVDAAAYESLVEQDGNALQLLVGATPSPDWLPPMRAAVSEASLGGAVTRPGGTSGSNAAALPTTDALVDTGTVALLVAPPADLPSSVLAQRPDVLAAEHALIASNADIGAARAAFYPRISLTGGAGLASTELGSLFRGGSRTWNLLPSISLPIFDGGTNASNLAISQAQRDIQLATYEKTLQTAFREVADALAVRRTLGERLAAQQSLVASTTRSFDLSQALFRSGSAAYLDVLDAQRSLYAAQQSLITLVLAEQVNRLTLYKVLGGGGEIDAVVASARFR
jgi:multidrug efflux system outer membrane protein